MISRAEHVQHVLESLREQRIVAVLGARQVGKTTLARQVMAEWPRTKNFFDLEDEADLALLSEPRLALEELRGLVVLDEIQRMPRLFEVLRVLADRPRTPCRFLITGSASPELLGSSSETLAGRVTFLELPGFSVREIGQQRTNMLWLRGGFPRSFLARKNKSSLAWRLDFVRTFLERDLGRLLPGVPATTMRRFWNMLAHYHGQIWNASEFGRSFGVADTTVRRYLDILSATFMVRQLPAYHANIGKRQVKAPKVFLGDSGILHALLDLKSMRDVQSHPKVGASWEGFVIEHLIQHLRARPDQCHFWATHTGAELDLLVTSGSRRLGFEIKRTTAPSVTRSMRSALEDLQLEQVQVIHAGQRTFPLARNIQAVAFDRILDDVEPL